MLTVNTHIYSCSVPLKGIVHPQNDPMENRIRAIILFLWHSKTNNLRRLFVSQGTTAIIIGLGMQEKEIHEFSLLTTW